MEQHGNVSWRLESARKRLHTTSGAQFAALLLFKPFVWFARAVVKWRSRSVAKSAYSMSSKGPGRHKSFTHTEHSGRKNVLRNGFCASLIAGSRRVFLCVDCVCLLLECWVKCTRCERLLRVKHFYLTCLLFFRRLKITLDSEQPMFKEKWIIPSVWGGIKGFEHFLRGECFSDCAFD